MNKKRVIVVCPGRGSYTRDTSGYLSKYGGSEGDSIKWMNEKRLNDNYESLTKLDAMPFRSKIHMVGENASPLFNYLTEKSGREIQWNFTKFLINKEGEFVRGFGTQKKQHFPHYRTP